MYSQPRPNILFVCARNKRRSRTAEYIFKNNDRFNVRSAGLSPSSERKLSEKDLQWADMILVMEKNHRSKVREQYGHLDLPPIEILDIEDEYEFMDDALICLLQEKVDAVLRRLYSL